MKKILVPILFIFKKTPKYAVLEEEDNLKGGNNSLSLTLRAVKNSSNDRDPL